MIRRITVTAFASALVAAASVAEGQVSCGATGGAGANCSPAGTQVTTTVQRIVRLDVTPTSATLTAPTDVDFAAVNTVDKDDAGHALTIRTNAAWSVTITGAAWTAPWAKPVGQLQFTTNGGTSYTPMTTTAQSIGSGAATVTSALTVGYRTTWTLPTDVPGTYTMPVTFTIAAP
jgi:hypothetical protein